MMKGTLCCRIVWSNASLGQGGASRNPRRTSALTVRASSHPRGTCTLTVL